MAFLRRGLRGRLQSIRRQLPSFASGSRIRSKKALHQRTRHVVRCPDCGLPMVRRERIRPRSRWPPVV